MSKQGEYVPELLRLEEQERYRLERIERLKRNRRISKARERRRRRGAEIGGRVKL